MHNIPLKLFIERTKGLVKIHFLKIFNLKGVISRIILQAQCIASRGISSSLSKGFLPKTSIIKSQRGSNFDELKTSGEMVDTFNPHAPFGVICSYDFLFGTSYILLKPYSYS